MYGINLCKISSNSRVCFSINIHYFLKFLSFTVEPYNKGSVQCKKKESDIPVPSQENSPWPGIIKLIPAPARGKPAGDWKIDNLIFTV